MRVLTFLVLFIAALYAGYWFVGSRAVTNGVDSAISQLEADGWQIDVNDIATKGFPSRFDTTLADLTLSPPDRAWQYTAPFVQALALSYAPNKVIAVLPNEQQLDLPNQSLSITSQSLRASTSVAASTDLTYQGFTAEGADINVRSDLGWDITITNLLSAMRPNPSGLNAYDVYAELGEVTLGDSIARLLSPAPATLQVIKADAVVTLDKPLDRPSFQSGSPVVPTNLDLRDASLRWGDISVSATGRFAIINGYPEGQLNLKVAEWEKLVDVLITTGMVNADVAATYRDVAALLATDAGELEIPITLQNGVMLYRIFPLGPAPRFY